MFSISTDSVLTLKLCNWTYDDSVAMTKLLITTTLAANLNEIQLTLTHWYLGSWSWQCFAFVSTEINNVSGVSNCK